jgi:hypothetical protein
VTGELDSKAALETVLKLKKVYFTFKNDGDKKQHTGIIAQELQKDFPELVSEDKDGILSVDYPKLSVITMSAIDELYSEIQEMKKSINELKNK